MTQLEEAIQLILNNIKVMESKELPLLQCLDSVTVEDIYSGVTLPMTSIAGPDGYAVHSSDIRGASTCNPVFLRVLGTSRAGYPMRKAILSGTAIRVMTGSVVPDGADCVIRFEDTDEPPDKNGPNLASPRLVKIFKAANPGDNIMPMGSSIQGGNLLLPAGTLIGPNHISALAAIGVTSLKVVRRPIIGVLPTGDELVRPGRPLPLGKVYDSNGPAIVSYITTLGGVARSFGIARDKRSSLIARLNKAKDVDALVTSGGVSKGDFDLVRLVLAERGNIIFSRVKMGPGASVTFAMIRRPGTLGTDGNVIPVFSLSGPPVGCLVNLETLLRPALLKMRGITQLHHPAVQATIMDGSRQSMPFSFARWSELEQHDGEYFVTLNGSASMGDLSTLARANALTIVPGSSKMEKGSRVQVMPLRWGLSK